MRLRFTAFACGLAALACAAAPSIAGAAPIHNRGLTIHAVPNPISAGDAVLIWGQLKGPDNGGQTIRLYHRINPRPFFSLVSTTRTNSAGQYEFVRAEGVVLTNRNWFVRGPGNTHSRTVHEHVQALVTLSASSTTGTTRHPIVFSGHVTPDHSGDVVSLQQQLGSSDRWQTIKRGRLGPGSNYNISYAWRVPGARNLRVRFAGDARNTAAASDVVAVVIQQAEVPDFTIQTSDPIVPYDQPVTISGVLDQKGTTTPEPNTSVSLFAARPGVGQYREVASTTTGADGSYSFAGVVSQTNELYRVRTSFAPLRSSAVLFEGAQDQVTLQVSSTTSTIGGHVTFTGTVSPDKAGHVIYLQKLEADNNWHTVAIHFVRGGSTFQFGWTFGSAGTKEFRAHITGGDVNVGGSSAPVTISVSEPPLASLPTG